jgi:hypothetical protein
MVNGQLSALPFNHATMQTIQPFINCHQGTKTPRDTKSFFIHHSAFCIQHYHSPLYHSTNNQSPLATDEHGFKNKMNQSRIAKTKFTS